MSGFFSIPVVYIDNRGQFLIPYFINFSRILDRSGGGHSFHGQSKPNLVSYPSSRLKEEKIRKHAVFMYGKGGNTAVVKKSAKIQL